MTHFEKVTIHPSVGIPEGNDEDKEAIALHKITWTFLIFFIKEQLVVIFGADICSWCIGA